MKISILIVTRKWKKEIHTFDYIFGLKHAGIDFEVLLAEGNNPSIQRNLLVKQAEGEYVLFLDDDSLPINTLLERYLSTLQAYPEIEILGGPSVLADNKSFLYNILNVFFTSAFGIGPIRSRYNSFGVIRKATEKDLILCNLLMKRDFFLKTKGFNQNLYPGEENEFLNKAHKRTNIIYDPKAIVSRKPRESIYLFLEQMFSYGNGRVKHLKLNSGLDYLFLIPLFFSIYVLSLPFLENQTFRVYFLVPLHFVFSASTIIRHKNANLSISQKTLLPFFFFMGHFSYGLGQVFGILQYKILKKLPIRDVPHEEIKIHYLKKLKNYSN